MSRTVVKLQKKRVAAVHYVIALIVGVCASHGVLRADETLVTALGERVMGRLTELSPTGELKLSADGRPRTFAAQEWLLFGNRRDTQLRPTVLLSDGSLLLLESWQLTSSQLLLPAGVRGIWNETKITRDAIRGLVFQQPANVVERDRLSQRVLNNREPHDQLLLENDDVLTGAILASSAVNAVSDESPSELKLKTKTGDVDVKVDRVRAILFGSLLGDTERPRRFARMMGFRDGTTLTVQRMQKEDAAVRVSLACGAEFVAESETLLDEIVFLQNFGANVTYLSDLTPLGYKHIPFLTREWPYEKDRAVDGGWLRHGGRLFGKGLGMHSTSRLAYDLDGEYKSFQAELAIDERAGTRGSVIFRVFVDRGEGNWQTAYESPIVRGSEKLLPINVDLQGATRMALIADFADRGDEMDHANWLNARLVK